MRADKLRAAGQVDHIRPKANGGSDDEVNLEAICADCHRKKTAEESGRPLKTKRRISIDGWPEEV